MLSDKELLVIIKTDKTKADKALYELWTRYQNLVHKNWSILRKQLNNSAAIIENRDDFYSESYIAFRKAVDAINLSKIYDDKWKFVGYFRFYLKNLRTEMISNVLKKYQVETSLYAKKDGDEFVVTDLYEDLNQSYNPEKDLENKLLMESINKCMQLWDSKKKQIFEWRMQGIPKSVIAARLHVHPAAVSYHLKEMKTTICKELRAR